MPEPLRDRAPVVIRDNPITRARSQAACQLPVEASRSSAAAGNGVRASARDARRSPQRPPSARTARELSRGLARNADLALHDVKRPRAKLDGVTAGPLAVRRPANLSTSPSV